MIDRTMPTPDAPEANRELVPRILQHIEETGGGAFVLFTSFRALREVAERCAPVLRSAGYPVFIHGEDGERSQLLKRFREHDHSVLFGTASFWEGVGRLIRSAEDSGRIVVLDPRIVTKFYGKRFMGALPEGVEPEMV
jgi:Rad3-related DNA helicase